MTVELLIQVGLGIIGFLLAFAIYGIKETLVEAVKSIQELNVKVAVIIERTEDHAKKHENHDANFERIKEDINELKIAISKSVK